MPTCGACYVCNAIRASYSETKKRGTYFLLQPGGAEIACEIIAAFKR